MSERVQSGHVEPIYIEATDLAGSPLVGATDLLVRVLRPSDGFWLDFADDTFKASGWTTRDAALAEVDATLAPGVYELPGGLDTGAILPTPASPLIDITTTKSGDTVTATRAAVSLVDESWLVYPLQSPGADAVLPPPREVKVGQWVDLIYEAWRRLSLDSANASEHKDVTDTVDGHMRT